MATHAKPRTNRTTLLTAAASVVTLVVAGIVVAVLLGSGGSSSASVPYRDPAAAGALGLCSKAGVQITSGSTTTKPFAWRAVSTSAAPRPYASGTATLYAFQPREGVTPDGWSGEMITASSRYRNDAHPTAAATGADIDLADFLTAYPAQYHGFVQLRLYLGGPNLPLRTTSYATADIQVSGSTWRQVGAPHVDCAVGMSAVSLETEVQPS